MGQYLNQLLRQMLVRSSSSFLFLYIVSSMVSLGAKPIKIKVAPVVAVKKETPSEDYSSWGQEPATSNVNQEDICESSLYLLRSVNSLTAIDFVIQREISSDEISCDPKKLKERKRTCRNTFCIEHFPREHSTINA